MTPRINTLITDCYDLLIKRKDAWFTPELATEFSKDVASRLQVHFNEAKGTPTLRLSQMGPKCPCALWHSIHHPELAEALPPWAMNKYSFGHIIEALAITQAKAAGHRVEGEQDAVYVDGVCGHRDCVIDGCIVDVKSCSSYSFDKFKDKTISEDDSFGYLDQLDGYMVGSFDDPLVQVKDRAYILAVDKVLGHMVLYEHFIRERSIRQRIEDYKRIVSRATAPACTCSSVPKGKSGNLGLDTRAKYSPYKFVCFPKLRTFLYSDGPVYLTEVVRKPDVLELDRYGKPV